MKIVEGFRHEDRLVSLGGLSAGDLFERADVALPRATYMLLAWPKNTARPPNPEVVNLSHATCPGAVVTRFAWNSPVRKLDGELVVTGSQQDPTIDKWRAE